MRRIGLSTRNPRPEGSGPESRGAEGGSDRSVASGGRSRGPRLSPSWARGLSAVGIGLIYLWAPAALATDADEDDAGGTAAWNAPDVPQFPGSDATDEGLLVMEAIPQPEATQDAVDNGEGGGTSPAPDIDGPGTDSSPDHGQPGGTVNPTIREVYEGDLVITTPGTVIDGVEVRGRISIKANDVTIRNSVVTGGAVATGDAALIQSWWGATNLRVEDSVLRASNPGPYISGVSGANFALSRVDISNVVDNVMVIGSNVTVRDSVLHSNLHYDNDPNHSDGTHDDNIQIVSGSNIVIENNRLSGSHNAAIMIGQDNGTISGVRIAGNRIGDGGCSINVHEKGRGPIANLTVSGNVFSPGGYGTSCPMRLPTSSNVQVSGNSWSGSSQAVTPQYF